MSAPMVSVVVPAYNAERYLPRTLDSILAQTYIDWELIIVDDGSTESTPIIASEYADRDGRIRLVRQQNRGLAGARNGGIAASNPESRYLIFLDADDLWEPDALQTLIDAHAASPAALIVFGDARYIDPDGQDLPDERRKQIPERKTIRDGRFVDEDESAPITFETLLAGNQIQTAGCALIPRSTVERVGLFDERMRRSEDWHYWLRASIYGSIVRVPLVVLAYRMHQASLSHNHQAQLTEAANTLKFLSIASDISAERKAAIDTVYAIRMGIGAGRIGEWEEAVRMLADVIRRGRIAAPADVLAADEPSINGPLLMALRGDVNLAYRISRQNAAEPTAPTSEEAELLSKAYRHLRAQILRIRSRLSVHALRRRRIGAGLTQALRLFVDAFGTRH